MWQKDWKNILRDFLWGGLDKKFKFHLVNWNVCCKPEQWQQKPKQASAESNFTLSLRSKPGLEESRHWFCFNCSRGNNQAQLRSTALNLEVRNNKMYKKVISSRKKGGGGGFYSFWFSKFPVVPFLVDQVICQLKWTFHEPHQPLWHWNSREIEGENIMEIRL